jgi:putative oxidoreductase
MALLILRLTTGTLVAGHGAQKLFGWFEGPGWRNTARWIETLNMKPGEAWGTLAGATEFTGGTLTALGLLDPLGPLAIISAMSMATATAHWGKPIWVTKGGAELAVTNAAVATALMAAGPGTISLDALFGTRLPKWLAIPGLAIAGATIYTAVKGQLPLPAETQAKIRSALPPEWQTRLQPLLPAQPTVNPSTPPMTEKTEPTRPQVAGTL